MVLKAVSAALVRILLFHHIADQAARNNRCWDEVCTFFNGAAKLDDVAGFVEKVILHCARC